MPLVWLTPLLWFCFTVSSLYSCRIGVSFFFVCNFAIHSLYSWGPGVWLFVCDFAFRSLYSCRPGVFCLWFLSFTVHTLAGQDFDFFLCYFVVQFILKRTRSILFVIFAFHSLYSCGPRVLVFIFIFYEQFMLVFRRMLRQLPSKEVPIQGLAVCWTVLEVPYIF